MKTWANVRYILLAGLLAGIGLNHFVYEIHKSHEYRAKIRELATELGRGPMRSSAVRSLLNERRFRGLKLREASPLLWEVETPLEFGARNWKLLLELNDSTVVTVKVRTEDSSERPPDGAPPDRVF